MKKLFIFVPLLVAAVILACVTRPSARSTTPAASSADTRTATSPSEPMRATPQPTVCFKGAHRADCYDSAASKAATDTAVFNTSDKTAIAGLLTAQAFPTAESTAWERTVEAIRTAYPTTPAPLAPVTYPDSTGACPWPGYSAYVIQTGGAHTDQRVCIYLLADPYINGYRPWVDYDYNAASPRPNCPDKYVRARLAIDSPTSPQLICLYEGF